MSGYSVSRCMVCADATSASMLLVVDGQVGNDNNPGTVSQPLATLAAAERRVPFLLDHDVEIRVVAAGTYALPSFRQRIYRDGQIYVRAVPSTTVLAATAAGAGTGVAVIKTSGLVTDQYIDNWIRMLSGAAVGQRRMIKSNTATDIVPVRDFSVAPAAGDIYEIVTPSVTLQGASGAATTPLLHGTLIPIHALTFWFEPSLNFENFLIDRPLQIAGRVVFWQCKTTSIGIPGVRSGHVMCGADSSAIRGAVGPSRVYGGSDKDMLGCGFVHQFNQEPDAGGFYGFINATQGLFIRNAPYTQIVGGSIRGDHTTIDGYGTVAYFGGDPSATPYLIDGPAQNTGTLRVRNGAKCVLQRISLLGQSGDIGVGVTGGGMLDVLAAGASISLVGNTYGIHAQSGGRVFFHEAAPNVTHTSLNAGTANLAVGIAPTVNNAASLPNIGDTLATPTGDGTMMTRVE